MFRSFARRALYGAAAFGLVATLGACDSMLEVENHGAINEDEVTDPALTSVMVNTAISAFQEDYAFLVYAGAMLSDEAVNGHNYEQWQEIDLRIIDQNNLMIEDIYEAAALARATPDDMVARLREVVEDPTTSLELATALTYAGYGHIILGEYFCYAPIETEGPAVESDGILAAAVERFDEAISILEGLSGADAERMLNLARVGAARASLGQGKFADAINYATDVPEDFVAWIRHGESPTYLRNYLSSVTQGTNQSIGVDVKFRDLNDKRVRHAATPLKGHNGKTDLWTPYQSSSFSGWAADGASQEIQDTTSIRFASGLEARYIIAEAGGMTDAELRAFIDERRAVGGFGPFAGTDAELQAELRDQRRRDFFLDGHRLGDLRRYYRLYGIDEFPTGPHPNDAQWEWGSYASATCFIPYRDELMNKNYVPLGDPIDPLGGGA